MIRIRESLPGDYYLLLQDLRREEIDELAALGDTCERCMRLGLLMGGARTAFINDEPVAMFGIVDYGDQVVAWGVLTRAIERHPIAFLRACRRFFDSLDCEVGNIVDARNVQALKWFRWLGFDLSQPEPRGLNGELFHQVTRRRRLEDGSERKAA